MKLWLPATLFAFAFTLGLAAGCGDDDYGDTTNEPATVEEVCVKMVECGQEGDVPTCMETLFEDGCTDEGSYLACMGECLYNTCADFLVCEPDCAANC